ncbi:hypothetical protein AAG570_005728 [Ranatra chinensis]|uniref:Uncharacterized protein n=1 Tax=Ranatra chinensis TaxID=642074 RepID=A0ABD0YD94_9HEMI
MFYENKKQETTEIGTTCEVSEDVASAVCGGNGSGRCVGSPDATDMATQAPLLQVESAKIQVVSSNGKQVCNLVQKELEVLQSHISHSQAVLAALRFSYFEDSIKKRRNNEYKINRTTQTSLPAETQPKSLEDVSQSKDRDWLQLTSSCPAIVNTVNIAVQTEVLESVKVPQAEDAEFFLPPIGSPLDFRNEMRTYQELLTRANVADHIDLDIYRYRNSLRSCRKLSVLPEEECESPPWLHQQHQVHCSEQQEEQVPRTSRQHHQQAHSFDSYLVPANREHHQEQVPRQMSDPTPSRSTRRPLRLQQASEVLYTADIPAQPSNCMATVCLSNHRILTHNLLIRSH